MNHGAPGKRISDRFVEQVALAPDAIALSSVAGDMTYRSLYERAMSLAGRIRDHCETSARRVAIVAGRGADFVVSVLACSLSDGTFVVLDAAYPDARIGQLLDICRPGLIFAAGGVGLAERCRDIARGTGTAVMSGLPDLAPAPLALPHANVKDDEPDRGRPGPPAYLLFTSGSTGAPKCVAVSHAPLIHFVEWHAQKAGVSRADRFSLVSGLSHDPVMRDIFTPLSVGARLVIPAQETIVAPGQLRQWFHEQGITIAHLTPSMGRLLCAQAKAAPELTALRRVFWGGERLTRDVVKALQGAAPYALQTNFYGCTETPQAICYFDVDPDAVGEDIPVGRPVDGFELFIAGENGEPVAPGTPGEICVRSPFLSMGYVSKGELVAAEQPDSYRTGDFGACDSHGIFSVIGRRDDQVKIRGFRVDLNEISAGLQALDGVEWAMSLPFDEANGQHIESFVRVSGNRWDANGLQRALAGRLPAYMVPARMHFLPDGPPLLPNGKVDRAALKRLAQAHTPVAPVAESSPQSGEEASLIAKWAAIFPGETLSARSSFKSLGGDSLSYVEAYLAAEELLGALPADWADQPIAQLARLRRTGHSFWAIIDSTIVIRCVAILMIIAYHAQLFPGGNGLTSAFFMISGYVFGTLKLPADLREFRAADSLNAMKRIFVPAVVFALLTCAIKVALHKRFPTEVLLFYANWIDYAALMARGGHVEPLASIFWYVDTLLQVIALTTLFALAAKYLSRTLAGSISATRFAVGLLALAVVLRVAVPLVLHPEYFRTGIEELSVWQISSLANLAPFALGMALTQWIRGDNRIAAMIVLLAYSLVDAQVFGICRGLAIAVTGLCMVWQPTLQVPRFAAGFIRTIAGSALFIYLTHQIFFATANGLLGRQILVVELLAGILGGVAVSLVWSRLAKGLNAMGGFVLRMTGVGRQG